MEYDFAEKRRADRQPFWTTIGYLCDDTGSRDLFNGVAVNISQSGMCLYLFGSPCLSEGQNINIASDVLVQTRRGTIRWIRKVEEDFFKVGLAFV